jgi:hypothetical protein
MDEKQPDGWKKNGWMERKTGWTRKTASLKR